MFVWDSAWGISVLEFGVCSGWLIDFVAFLASLVGKGWMVSV